MKPLDKYTTFKNQYQKADNFKSNEFPDDDLNYYKNILHKGFNNTNNNLALISQGATENQSQKALNPLEKKILQPMNFIESDDDIYYSQSNSSDDSSKTGSSSDDISETDKDDSQSDHAFSNINTNANKNDKEKGASSNNNKGKKDGNKNTKIAKTQKRHADDASEIARSLNKGLNLNKEKPFSQGANGPNGSKRNQNRNEGGNNVDNKNNMANTNANSNNNFNSINNNANNIKNGISFNNNLSSISSINPNSSISSKNNTGNINNRDHNPFKEQYQKHFDNKNNLGKAANEDDINNNKKTPEFNQLKKHLHDTSNKIQINSSNIFNTNIIDTNNKNNNLNIKNKTQITSRRQIPNSTNIKSVNGEEKDRGLELVNTKLVNWMKNPLTTKKDYETSSGEEEDSTPESSEYESESVVDPSKSVTALQPNSKNNLVKNDNKVNNTKENPLKENVDKNNEIKASDDEIVIKIEPENDKNKNSNENGKDKMDIVEKDNNPKSNEANEDVDYENNQENFKEEDKMDIVDDKAPKQTHNKKDNYLKNPNERKNFNIKNLKEESTSSVGSSSGDSSIYVSERSVISNPTIAEIKNGNLNKKENNKAAKESKNTTKAEKAGKFEVSNFSSMNQTKNTDIRNNLAKKDEDKKIKNDDLESRIENNLIPNPSKNFEKTENNLNNENDILPPNSNDSVIINVKEKENRFKGLSTIKKPVGQSNKFNSFLFSEDEKLFESEDDKKEKSVKNNSIKIKNSGQSNQMNSKSQPDQKTNSNENHQKNKKGKNALNDASEGKNSKAEKEKKEKANAKKSKKTKAKEIEKIDEVKETEEELENDSDDKSQDEKITRNKAKKNQNSNQAVKEDRNNKAKEKGVKNKKDNMTQRIQEEENESKENLKINEKEKKEKNLEDVKEKPKGVDVKKANYENKKELKLEKPAVSKEEEENVDIDRDKKNKKPNAGSNKSKKAEENTLAAGKLIQEISEEKDLNNDSKQIPAYDDYQYQNDLNNNEQEAPEKTKGMELKDTKEIEKQKNKKNKTETKKEIKSESGSESNAEGKDNSSVEKSGSQKAKTNQKKLTQNEKDEKALHAFLNQERRRNKNIYSSSSEKDSEKSLMEESTNEKRKSGRVARNPKLKKFKTENDFIKYAFKNMENLVPKEEKITHEENPTFGINGRYSRRVRIPRLNVLAGEKIQYIAAPDNCGFEVSSVFSAKNAFKEFFGDVEIAKAKKPKKRLVKKSLKNKLNELDMNEEQVADKVKDGVSNELEKEPVEDEVFTEGEREEENKNQKQTTLSNNENKEPKEDKKNNRNNNEQAAKAAQNKNQKTQKSKNTKNVGKEAIKKSSRSEEQLNTDDEIKLLSKKYDIVSVENKNYDQMLTIPPKSFKPYAKSVNFFIYCQILESAGHNKIKIGNDNVNHNMLKGQKFTITPSSFYYILNKSDKDLVIAVKYP